jgi:hypothetical protein
MQRQAGEGYRWGMTLRLAHDADANVEKLEVYNFQDIAGCARRFADQLEAGGQGEPTRVIVVVDLPEGIAMACWGENANGFETVGILESAKIRAYQVYLDGDE